MNQDPVDARYLRPSEWVRRVLRDRIISGLYPPGSYLPSERLLSGELGVARMTLRVAINRLAEEELVTRRTDGRGTLVANRARQEENIRVGIVYVAPELAGRPEGAMIVRGVTDRLVELGYPARAIAYGVREREREVLSTPVIPFEDIPQLGEGLAGLVFIELVSEEIQKHVLRLEERRYPVVVANMERDYPVSATWVNHASCIRQAVDILVSLGHRRIAYVAADTSWFFYPDALNAYKDAMAYHNLPTDASLLALTSANNANSVGAYRAVKALLEGANRPTAIVAARDYYAEGACQAVEDIGAVVGRDISVFGFDNSSWQGRDHYLTTFQEPCYEMGAAAAEMLVERVTHGWRPIEKREIKAKLIMRRSVGPAPKSAPEPQVSEPAGVHSGTPVAGRPGAA